MGLDAFGRMVRDIRLVRAMLLYDMAKDLDISSVELSAIECGRKPVPDWFISKLQEKYGISDMHAQSLQIDNLLRALNCCYTNMRAGFSKSQNNI